MLTVKGRNGKKISMPSLDLTGIGLQNRIFLKGNGVLDQDEDRFAKAKALLNNAHLEGCDESGDKIVNVESGGDCFNFATSSGDDSLDRQKVKDIIFDPAKRKRLLDSLTIMSVRNKWDCLLSPT
jgi:hypothetical protein